MRQRLRQLTVVMLIGALAAVAGCQRGPDDARRQQVGPERLSVAHLPNAFRLHEKVISGGLPNGEVAFKELKDLGIKTIISVDGAKPDVELAKKYGLRYVHLPHGYDGIPEERATELAKAVRDLEWPIYIHCHHGHHRSPAAATVACVSAGLLEPSQAVGVLKAAGTSETYRGLYQSARSARRLDDALLDALLVDFPETAQLPPLAEAMVDLERTHDHLKLIAASRWNRPATHPDLDPAHQALLLREHFTELVRTEAVQNKSAAFQDLMRQGEAAARELEELLAAWSGGTIRSSPPRAISKSFERVSANCAACHRGFRDVPQAETGW